jgi:hypothetical protein
MPRIYPGGCHCGRVRFEVRTEKATVLECNCSICKKKGYLHLIIPADEFTLLSGSAALATYTFNTGAAKHHFCQTCGVAPFYRPRSHPEHYDVNVRCLDGNAGSDFAVVPFDGENWEENVGKIR